ncbi:trihelix transcription factor ENAP2-like [Nymphaea colorata]|uniref:Myb-like domain-containing protein n=1 Tax=Nymphaea colorata TaxID=210225 RepID=A0A5K1FMT4_9MAGN|nr:trihelix transcription factor ENAP2-like [Nymphaea colorata]
MAADASSPSPSPSPSRSSSPPPTGDPPSSSPTPKKPPPGPWSHQESIHLIDAYQERWYALGRGQLRARHWEEVASSLAARCGLHRPAKTSTQCRHKIEKLRKRYRAELQKEASGSCESRWILYPRMDLLEKGPSSILRAVHPPRSLPPLESPSPISYRHAEAEAVPRFGSVGRKPSAAGGVAGARGPCSPGPSLNPNPNPSFPKRKRTASPAAAPALEEQEALLELASAVRSIGDGLMRVENLKMEMMRDMERSRMDMEMKRTEMILESQREIAEVIAKAYCSKKKYKRLSSPDS